MPHDVHKTLAFESNLYPASIINNFGASQPGWNLMSNREKELLLLRINCNILICNLELLEDITELVKKRKRPCEEVIEVAHSSTKKSKISEEKVPDVEEKSSKSSTSTSSSSNSKKTWMEEEEKQIDELDISKFRLRMIRYMPNAEGLMMATCKQWGIERVEETWDIADHKTKKFIAVRISTKSDKEIAKFMDRSTLFKKNSALIIIHPYTFDITWVNHEDHLASEQKVRAFLLKRKMIADSLGIIETPIQTGASLIRSVFKSGTFLRMMAKWKQDWNKESFKQYRPTSLYGTEINEPKTITPSNLLDKLSDLEEDFRVTTIKWKGKLAPEGWVTNKEGRWETDKEMVEAFMEILRSEEIIEMTCLNDKQKEIDGKELVREIEEILRANEKNTFLLYTPGSKDKEMPNIDRLIGFKKKKRTFNPDPTGMKQKRGSPISPLKYDSYFEEVIRRLNENGVDKENTYVYANLLKQPDTDNHPIAEIAEAGATGLLRHLLVSRAAVWSSKYTNCFSRVGGAYSGGSKRHNKMRSGVAIFPIYANTTTIEYGEEVDNMKLLSGIVIRGPNHAKSPTDRIPMATIEAFKNKEDNKYLISHMSNGIVLKTKSYVFLIRSNSIMKEDTAYLTFTMNSLFNPANMLGLVTLENTKVPQNCNMLELQGQVLEGSHKWFTERFTEGVLMAAVGNSRDEGYFACLRKIAMILYSWKYNDSVANWNIESFCRKTNDTLIDNPLSMHFHLNVLEAIKQYQIPAPGQSEMVREGRS